jgi:nicotinate-nucleotide pyrophosphorylase (carboxylating)
MPVEHAPPSQFWGQAEEDNARALIAMAVREDLGERGDITALATIPESARGRAVVRARQQGTYCGGHVLELLAREFRLSGPGRGLDRLTDAKDVLVAALADGDLLASGREIAVVEGPVRSILAFERTALNFLQRLSGVATMTSRFVGAVAGTKAVILDTRKTTPGWRALEKYAVRCGGGANHRIGLHDAVLIKDNHLAFLAETGDPIGRAVAAGREFATRHRASFVEVEVDGLDQLDRALECRPDIVLLDNFTLSDLKEAVSRRNDRSPSILLEASGGVNLYTVYAIAATGVDRISVGALTHSAPALDIALDHLPDGST